MEKKYSEEIILHRLISIQKIHDAIKNNQDTSKYTNIDKITYILWQSGNARNSDINLSIDFYKQFYSEYIEDDKISLEDLYNIPKMYDIQRTRAHIQNTEGLFPATEEVQLMRIKRAKKMGTHYREEKRKTFRGLPDYYLYFDESGKTDKYFVLAGVLINGKKDNQSQRLRLNELKKRLNSKYKLNIEELKFADIKKRNLDFYKEFLDELFKEGIPAIFLSIVVENKGLKQSTERKKTKDVLEILLKDLTSIIVRGTCGSSYINKKAKLNIILDKDGNGYDDVEREKIKQKLDVELKQLYKYLLTLDEFTDIDSKDNIFVQFSDLYASSLNNIFSDVKSESETSKCKKEFAQHFLKYVGIKDIKETFPQKDKKNKNDIVVKFINKFISSND